VDNHSINHFVNHLHPIFPTERVHSLNYRVSYLSHLGFYWKKSLLRSNLRFLWEGTSLIFLGKPGWVKFWATRWDIFNDFCQTPPFIIQGGSFQRQQGGYMGLLRGHTQYKHWAPSFKRLYILWGNDLTPRGHIGYHMGNTKGASPQNVEWQDHPLGAEKGYTP